MTEINATPSIPDSQSTTSDTASKAIKVATPDILLFDDSAVPVSLMTELIFEDIGAQEIITISRNDIVNGQDVSYNLIGNLSKVQKQYNTKNIFSLPDTSEKYFKNFAIRFDTHIPEKGSGPNEERVYIVSSGTDVTDAGDLVIDVTNMEVNERVDVEILRRGQILDDTIYTEES